MQRQRQQKRAAPLTVSVDDATGCQTMPISWDASTGKAPWTVMVAPVNQVPYTLSVASASGSNFVANWSVPKLRGDAQALVAVADSTGAVSGVSSLINLKAGTGTCTGLADNLDFVWYPTKDLKTPGQCDDWSITWQQDKGNNGVQGQVTYTFLPEKGQPVTTAAGTGDKGSFKWSIPFDQGTKFLVVGNDGGQGGTGGVGDLYSVSSGPSKTCKTVGIFGNGLPSPSSTLSGVASSATAASKSGKTSAAGNASATRKSGTQATSTSASSASSTDEKHNTAGTAVGATFGVLGALAVIGVLVWWWRRRRNNEERKAWGGAPVGGGASKQSSQGGDIGYPVSPWRWSTSPYEPPQTTSRASKWLSRASGSAAVASNFRALSRSGHDGHGRSGSITTAAQPNMQQAAFRNMSVPEDDYALSNMTSNDGYLQQRSGAGAQSVHSTVPDATLFPPPPPQSRNIPRYDDGGYGTAQRQGPSSHSQYQQQYQSQNQAPFADPPMDSPLSEVRQGTSLSSGSNGNAAYGGESGRNLMSTGGAQNQNDYIGPIGPTKTSIYDPYTHMSQVYDDSNGSMADRIQQAGAGPHGTHGMSPYTHQAGAVSSEVMMPTDRDRFASHFAKTGPTRKAVATGLDDDDDDDGLPYL